MVYSSVALDTSIHKDQGLMDDIRIPFLSDKNLAPVNDVYARRETQS